MTSDSLKLINLTEGIRHKLRQKGKFPCRAQLWYQWLPDLNHSVTHRMANKELAYLISFSFQEGLLRPVHFLVTGQRHSSTEGQLYRRGCFADVTPGLSVWGGASRGGIRNINI